MASYFFYYTGFALTELSSFFSSFLSFFLLGFLLLEVATIVSL